VPNTHPSLVPTRRPAGSNFKSEYTPSHLATAVVPARVKIHMDILTNLALGFDTAFEQAGRRHAAKKPALSWENAGFLHFFVKLTAEFWCDARNRPSL
jgi:hypothetical protein